MLLHVLGRPLCPPFYKRQQHSRGRVHTGGDVHRRNAQPHRAGLGRTVDAHQAAIALHDCVVTWPTAERPILAEA